MQKDPCSTAVQLLSKAEVHPLTPSPCRCSRDEVKLLDPTGSIVSSVGWQSADMGTVLRLQPDLKTYRAVPETKNVLETLTFLGGYDTFIAALKVSH